MSSSSSSRHVSAEPSSTTEEWKKGKEKERVNDESSGSSTSEEGSPEQNTTDWQAVWAPAQNAYYFYNTKTMETTWTNPLIPPTTNNLASTSSTADEDNSSNIPSTSTSTATATLDGIDPALAYLDPSSTDPQTGRPSAPHTFTAKFNARTGVFTKSDARDPTHLSEFERAKRMSEVYFDVSQWEADIAAREQAEKDGTAGAKRKRVTKADLERFKEQKKQKKIAKTAWLRS